MPARDDQRSLWVGWPTKERLDRIKAKMQQDKGRGVTMSEVIEYLLERAAES